MTEPWFAKDAALLLMECQKCNGEPYTYDELRAMADAGIKNAIIFDVVWRDIEPAWGKYNWRALDERVALVNKAGMRAAIKWYTPPLPSYFPSDWWACASGGPIVGILSPWCPQAANYELQMIDKVCRRYNDASLGNIVVSGIVGQGETPMQTVPAWYDAFAVADFRRVCGVDAELRYPDPNGRVTDPTYSWLKQSCLAMLKRQGEMFIDNPWHTLFCAFQPAFDGLLHWDCTGVQWLDDILGMYNTLASDAQTVQIFYNWIGMEQFWANEAALSGKHHTLMFGGAEYCEGLRGKNSTHLAIENFMAGQVIAPCHQFTGHNEVTPDMLSEIAWATGEWRKARAGL